MSVVKLNPLAVNDRMRRTWCYRVRDPAVAKGESGFEDVIYIGKSFDPKTRWGSHQRAADGKSSSGAEQLRTYTSKKSYPMVYERISEGGIDLGVPRYRIDEFEGFFIVKEYTMHDPIRNPRGCNNKNGDHLASLEEGWFDRLQAELDAGFQWPDVYDVPNADLVRAQGDVAMYEAAVELQPNCPELKAKLNECRELLKLLEPYQEFDVDSPFARARELKDKYGSKPKSQLVSRDTVSCELSSLQEHAEEEELADDVAGMVRLWQQTVHPDKERLRGQPLTAGYAASLFALAYEWCGEREELMWLEKHDKEPVKHVAKALKLKAWLEAHDGRMPAQHKKGDDGKSNDEGVLASSLSRWRAGDNGVNPQAARSLHLVLLRQYPLFEKFCRGTRIGTGAQAVLHATAALLQQNFGIKEPGTRPMPSLCPSCGNFDKRYQCWNNFRQGNNSKGASILLVCKDGMTQERIDAARALHAANRPLQLGRMSAVNGRIKRRRQDGEGSSRPMDQKSDSES